MPGPADIPANGQPAGPPRNRGWIWVFVLLAVLGVTVVAVEIWYNAGQQLTPDQVAQALAKWKASGPRDYDLTYTKKRGADVETYDVQVRHGKVVYAELNGRPLEERLLRYQDMTALLGFVDDFARKDAEAVQAGGRRPFEVGHFDPTDGHLTHYVRSAGRDERVELTVTRFEPKPAS